ncbi:uncharacterized protein LOC119403448 [Rhipicephalus sanguineus]|uniref:uncharacterized protein LOC119403448 n=1 Tax=Rhipicephalus sanguineus TaxID=34632 RepID=UPI001895226A|nr:uncharacterized protein LOC119403448 [Rhipicephalus sanguineus]
MENFKALFAKLDCLKKSNGPSNTSRTSLVPRQHALGSAQMSHSMDVLSSPPFNTAMHALRKLKHPAKGATPFSQVDSFRPCGHHVRALLMACSGALAAGMALGYGSAAMPSIERRFRRDAPSEPPDNRWIPDSLFLGASVGALISGILLHLAGHRRTLLLCSGGLTSFWVSLMLANKVSMMVVSRVAIGICVGVITNCVCLYVTDVAPPAKRTLYGGLVEVATSAGMLCAYAMAGFAWQQQAVGCAMASVPMLALQRYVIENPRWLMSKHLSLDADTALMRLYGVDPPPDFRDHKGKAAEEQKPAATSSRLWPSNTRRAGGRDLDRNARGGVLDGRMHLPTLLTGELMPSRIRLLGSSIVWSSRWLLAFLLRTSSIDVLTAFQQKGPLLALSLTVAAVATTAIYLIPETEGRTLDQIEHD